MFSPTVIRRVVCVSLFIFIFALACRKLLALPPGFSETQVATGLANATAMALAPDGRLFVCLQGGQLRVIKNGTLLATPLVTLSVDSSGERGLLGVAFDPNFFSNHFIYLYYTPSSTPKHNQVSRFTVNGDAVDPASETLVFRLDDLGDATIHNAGALHFGADGKLYVAVGENNQGPKAQSLDSLFGKILRLNPDGSIPTDNPFNNVTTGNRRAIWAMGLRNPFTFAVQNGTGRIFINDVGQDTWEEINEGVPGANYGWPDSEGTTSNPNFRNPFFAYNHDGTTISGCAITGGVFYSPPVAQFPQEYVGKYFFADFCGGWIRTIDPISAAVADFATGLPFPVDLQISPDGSLYYLARGAGGFIGRIQFTQSAAPSISTQPLSQLVTAGDPVTFTVTATGAQPLSYQWQRDGADISGAQSSTYTLSTTALADNGAKFRVSVSNNSGSALSQEAVLSVTSNRPPVGTITSPVSESLYSGGETITYGGQAQDPEDGALPASAFTWRVDFQHHTHTHPFIPSTSGVTGGKFTIPTSGETDSDVWYRIYLTVTDSGGLTQTTFRDVLPRKANITLATNPSGLKVQLDGQPETTPFTFTGVVGIKRTLGIDSPQISNGTSYQFSSWSDSGAASHEISTPGPDTTYTANLTALPGVNSFQFSQAAYEVAEDGGHVNVTVNRTGDLSTAAAVDYATEDQTANDRSDYTTTLGTLQFSPGESSKVVTVLITDDALFEGDKTFRVRLSKPRDGLTLGTPDTATVSIRENDTASSPLNPVDDTEFFVREHYHDFLNREPDTAGLQFWANEINSCGTDTQCREVRRNNVSAAFFLSIEFQQTGFLVYLLYESGLNRAPTYRELLRDTQELSRGVVVNASGWEDQLAANQTAFVNEFAQRPDFIARYPANLTPDQYVDTMNSNDGNILSKFERDFIVSALQAGSETRAQVLRHFAESWDLRQREFNRAFVLMQYFGYLRRNPDDPPNSDCSGFNFWLDKLNRFDGDFIKAEMVRAFLVSLEYRQRFGHP